MGPHVLATLEDDLRLTPYRPIAAIGHGGMGSVFEVEHRSLRHRLVIKILRETNRPDLEDRLRLEAQTLARLSHPNLLAVRDFARTASGRPFLVCERLVGRTLKELLGPTGALPVAEAVAFARQALAGLGEAHRAGVVHRDVKLDNLFVCDPTPTSPVLLKVIDFGIAKWVGGAPGELPPVAPLEVPTAEGVMVGTPSCMAPEQVKNLPVDHRADLYGVGVVLYRAITGRNPFLCRDVFEYATAHATEPPPPPSRFAALPVALEQAILRALAKDPAERWDSAAGMSAALEAAQAKPTPRASATVPLLAPPPVAAAKPVVRTIVLRAPSTPELPPPSQTAPMTPPMPPPPSPAERAPIARPRRALEIVLIVLSVASAAAIVWFSFLLLATLR